MSFPVLPVEFCPVEDCFSSSLSMRIAFYHLVEDGLQLRYTQIGDNDDVHNCWRDRYQCQLQHCYIRCRECNMSRSLNTRIIERSIVRPCQCPGYIDISCLDKIRKPGVWERWSCLGENQWWSLAATPMDWNDRNQSLLSELQQLCKVTNKKLFKMIEFTADNIICVRDRLCVNTTQANWRYQSTDEIYSLDRSWPSWLISTFQHSKLKHRQLYKLQLRFATVRTWADACQWRILSITFDWVSSRLYQVAESRFSRNHDMTLITNIINILSKLTQCISQPKVEFLTPKKGNFCGWPTIPAL